MSIIFPHPSAGCLIIYYYNKRTKDRGGTKDTGVSGDTRDAGVSGDTRDAGVSGDTSIQEYRIQSLYI